MADKVTFVFDSAFVDVTFNGTPVTAGVESTVEVGQKVKILPKPGFVIISITGASASGALYKCDVKNVKIEHAGPHATITYPADKIEVNPTGARVNEFITITAKSGYEIDQVTGATFDSGKNKYKINAVTVTITAKNAPAPPTPPDQMVVKSPQFWHHVKNINNMN